MAINTTSAAVILRQFGQGIVFYGTAAIFIGFGLYKFTAIEAEQIFPLTSNSPLFGWLYQFMNKQSVSNLIGITELILVALMLWRHNWLASFIGSMGIAISMLATLSFLATTPGIGADGFLIKDIVLLGGALWAAGMALEKRSGQAGAV